MWSIAGGCRVNDQQDGHGSLLNQSGWTVTHGEKSANRVMALTMLRLVTVLWKHRRRMAGGGGHEDGLGSEVHHLTPRTTYSWDKNDKSARKLSSDRTPASERDEASVHAQAQTNRSISIEAGGRIVAWSVQARRSLMKVSSWSLRLD